MGMKGLWVGEGVLELIWKVYGGYGMFGMGREGLGLVRRAWYWCVWTRVGVNRQGKVWGSRLCIEGLRWV